MEYSEEIARWVSTESVTAIVETVLFAMLHQLYNQGKIDMDRQHDWEYLWSLVRFQPLEFIDSLRFVTRVDNEFIEMADQAVQQNKLLVAILLVASSIEHSANEFYRKYFECKGIPEDQTTQIIRRANLDEKLGWLLIVNQLPRLPEDLQRKVQEIVEMRNIIVHHKFIPHTFKDDPPEMTLLKRAESISSELLQTASKVNTFFQDILAAMDPSMEIVKNLLMFMMIKHPKIKLDS